MRVLFDISTKSFKDGHEYYLTSLARAAAVERAADASVAADATVATLIFHRNFLEEKGF